MPGSPDAARTRQHNAPLPPHFRQVRKKAEEEAAAAAAQKKPKKKSRFCTVS